MTKTRTLLFTILLVFLTSPAWSVPTPSSIRDLTIHQGDIPRRLVGYGLVVGLEGTGDRSFGGPSSQNPTVSSVVNLLRRFNLEVPADYLRLQNVAAVLVTAEVSPYLRAGGRFPVQVSALGDATSLEGGVLWMTPLVVDPLQPPLATAQGGVLVSQDNSGPSSRYRLVNSGRIPDGGVLEVDPIPNLFAERRLLLKNPNRVTAVSIANAVNQALGGGTAQVEDPGSILLTFNGNPDSTLAAIDVLPISVDTPARVVIHGREGTVVAGGDVRVGSAVIHHHGLLLQIGGDTPAAGGGPGVVRVEPEALVQDVAAGLHAVGASAEEVAVIFEALREAGALNAEVVVR